MEAVLKLDGTAEHASALLMHNERLANPLNPYARKVGEIASRRKKTELDHLDLAVAEFVGGLYTNGNGPCVPGWNIIRCLQEGATRFKRGRDVLRGVHPINDHADLIYEGPRDEESLWEQDFWITKGVGIGQSKVMRTRPMFENWKAEFPVEIDEEIFDLKDVALAWERSGRHVGLGDGRPIFGRFVGTVAEITEDEAAKMKVARLGDTKVPESAARKAADSVIAAVQARARARLNGKK